jgi:hypothetical protein
VHNDALDQRVVLPLLVAAVNTAGYVFATLQPAVVDPKLKTHVKFPARTYRRTWLLFPIGLAVFGLTLMAAGYLPQTLRPSLVVDLAKAGPGAGLGGSCQHGAGSQVVRVGGGSLVTGATTGGGCSWAGARTGYRWSAGRRASGAGRRAGCRCRSVAGSSRHRR